MEKNLCIITCIAIAIFCFLPKAEAAILEKNGFFWKNTENPFSIFSSIEKTQPIPLWNNLKIFSELKFEKWNLKNFLKKSEYKDYFFKRASEKGVCASIWNPICGKNGITYSNGCFAGIAGIETDYEGTCLNNKDEKLIKFDEARKIALESECGQAGKLAKKGNYNKFTKTWWIDLEVSEETIKANNLDKKMCNPSCIIGAESKKAAISWQCIGLIVP